jgi:hypothetical protein
MNRIKPDDRPIVRLILAQGKGELFTGDGSINTKIE